jgi:probable F420-dependent oxidoreductase
MTLALGPTAVWSGLDHLGLDEAVDFVRRVEAAGYDGFWTREGFGRDPFALLARVAPATSRISLGTSIANVHARDAAAMRAAAHTLQEIAAGRFVLGLGVSHKPWVEDVRGHDYGSPVAIMERFLDAYDRVPYRAPTPSSSPPVVLAALRSRMIALAGARTDGAFPYLVPATAVPTMRVQLDRAAADAGRSDARLIVAQGVLIETDPDVARQTARSWIKVYLGLPAYVASLRGLGFDDDDLGEIPSDRLVDALVAWGDAAAVRRRLQELIAAGADQVAVVPLRPDGTVGSAAGFEAVAPPW